MVILLRKRQPDWSKVFCDAIKSVQNLNWLCSKLDDFYETLCQGETATQPNNFQGV